MLHQSSAPFWLVKRVSISGGYLNGSNIFAPWNSGLFILLKRQGRQPGLTERCQVDVQQLLEMGEEVSCLGGNHRFLAGKTTTFGGETPDLVNLMAKNILWGENLWSVWWKQLIVGGKFPDELEEATCW